MAEVATLTRVKDGHGDALRALLRAISGSSAGDRPVTDAEGARESPFAGLGRTHFARLVVIDVPEAHLFFSSRFDGEEEKYLTALARAPKSLEIWGHCQRPSPVEEQTLAAYLLKGPDRVRPSYVVSVLPERTTVAQINRALELRDAIGRFAARSGRLDALALAHAFRQIEPVSRLAGA
jgi:hypothetical protein